MSAGWSDLIPKIVHDARALIRKGLSNAQLLELALTSAGDANDEAVLPLRAVIESQVDLTRFLDRLMVLSDAERVHCRSTPARGPHANGRIDLETAVLAAKIELREEIKRAAAEIHVKNLPACTVPAGAPTVFRELIDNALRYRDASRSLHIVIEAQHRDGTLRVSFLDNGTGVPPDCVNKVFQPLQRLDRVRSGFGLGLTIANVIATAAGGRIYLEPSDPGANFVAEFPLDSSGHNTMEGGLGSSRSPSISA